MKHQDTIHDVFVPFRADLPAGHSKFTVEVPSSFVGSTSWSIF